jgi:hypothetical protein
VVVLPMSAIGRVQSAKIPEIHLVE